MIDFFLCFNDNDKKEIQTQWEGRGEFIEENFELWFILRRIGHFCIILSSYLSNKLNNCGWRFKRDDNNHKLYKQYQKYEEFRRLISTLVRDIDKKPNKLLTNDELHESYDIVKNFNLFFELNKETYQFPNSKIEIEKLIKILYTMENYCYKAIRKRDII